MTVLHRCMLVLKALMRGAMHGHSIRRAREADRRARLGEEAVALLAAA